LQVLSPKAVFAYLGRAALLEKQARFVINFVTLQAGQLLYAYRSTEGKRTVEAALRRFKRTIEKTGLLTELRSREFYEKPTAERKRKHAAAVKRHYKRIRSQQLPPRLY